MGYGVHFFPRPFSLGRDKDGEREEDMGQNRVRGK